MRTDTSEFKELQTRWSSEPGKVHGAIYKKAFGESCNDVNVVGEGFGIIDGEFKIASGAFNKSHGDEYHDSSRDMNPESRRCLKELVRKWMQAESNSLNCQNYDVSDLLMSTRIELASIFGKKLHEQL